MNERVAADPPLTTGRVALMLVLAGFGTPMLLVAAMGAGPLLGALATAASLQGYLLGLAWSTLLQPATDYRSRLTLGISGLAATAVGSTWVLRHTNGVGSSALATVEIFAMAEGLTTLLVLLSDTRHPSCPVAWS